MTIQIVNNKKRNVLLAVAVALSGLGYALWPTGVSCDSSFILNAPKPCGEESIIVYDENGKNPRYVCHMSNLDNKSLPTTHSVTGGIGFGNDFGANAKVELTTNDGTEVEEQYNDCIMMNNGFEEVKIIGDFFVSVSCEKLQKVSTMKNPNFDGNSSVGELMIQTMVFEGNHLITDAQNEHFVLQDDLMMPTNEIASDSYYGRCVNNKIACQALAHIKTTFCLESPMQGFTQDNDYTFVFYVVDVDNTHEDKDHQHANTSVVSQTVLFNQSLSYYESIKSDVNNHNSEHISLIPFKLCTEGAFPSLSM